MVVEESSDHILLAMYVVMWWTCEVFVRAGTVFFFGPQTFDYLSRLAHENTHPTNHESLF